MSRAPATVALETRPLEWPEAARKQVEEALTHYPNRRSAVLPALWIAQRTWGWIPPEALRLVARTVELPEPEVFGIATFYTMFNLQPVGRHHLQLCLTVSCSLVGADRLYEHLRRRLGIGHGETTPDGRFTLRKVECLAACGNGPCMQVNEDYYENLDEAAVDRILEKLT
ncbi:MAG: NADH-quinone oxidoreductase subunit NuoE [Candidatus Eisenbacteria bacterium]|nr:NADH-quinone oxidoreductase subunit NuoE [Candidatus Eisenbacteria bacterium]